MKKKQKKELPTLSIENLMKESMKIQKAEKYLEIERKKLIKERENVRRKIKKEREILKLKKRIQRIKSEKR